MAHVTNATFTDLTEKGKTAAKKSAGMVLVSARKNGNTELSQTRYGIATISHDKNSNIFSINATWGTGAGKQIFSGNKRETVKFIVESLYIYHKHD